MGADGRGAARDGRGSVLMLVPAAVLVLVVLGAITVDFTVAFLGEREMANAAHAAANDAASAIDETRFRATGEVVLDCGRAAEVADAAFTARSPGWLVPGSARVAVTGCGGRAVEVTVRARVAYVFAPALPGAPDHAEVEAVATAEARTG